jgi:uncharacterized protein (TIGR00730 family)
MILTVFGGSAPKPGSAAYQQAMDLGRMAAEAGWTVATGGYMGVMEAVSRGANEAGGHVIGVTTKELDDRRPTGANPWVKEERKFDTLRTRLGHLVDCCDAAMALPGGVGTLAEISIMWNGLIIHSLPAKPLVLVGKGWKTTIDQLYAELGDYVGETDRKWVSYANNIEDGFNLIRKQI